MLKSMTSTQIDELVLDLLRKVAQEGQEGKIRGKTVRLAEPKDGICVYRRIALQAHEEGRDIFDSGLSLRELYRMVQASMQRLTRKDQIFSHVTGEVDERSFWVVMK